MESARAYYEAGLCPLAFIQDGDGTRKPPFKTKGKTRRQLFEESCKFWGARPNDTLIALATGQEANMVMIDLDTHTTGDQMNGLEAFGVMANTNNMSGLENAISSRTRSGGMHLFFKYTDKLKNGQGNLFFLNGKKCAIDIRSKFTSYAIVPPSNGYTWIYSPLEHPLTECPDWIIQWHQNSVLRKDIKKKQQGKSRIPFQELVKVVNGLGTTRYDGLYDTWFALIAAIIRTGKENNYLQEAKELVHAVSSKSSRYSYAETENKIQSLVGDDQVEGYDFRTLLKWLGKDNPALEATIMCGRRTFDVVKKEFEERHFKVMFPLMFCYEDVDDELRIINGIKLTYENMYYEIFSVKFQMWGQDSFIPRWLKQEDIRTYRIMDFLPPPHKCPPDVYNMYRGLHAETLPPVSEPPQGLQLILNHFENLCGNNQRSIAYCLNWLAYRVQKPGLVPRTALIFRSDQGSGKSTFFDFFGKKVLGKRYYFNTQDIDHIFGRFAVGIKHKMLIVLEEAEGKDTFRTNARLKANITAETIQYEKKGVDTIEITNCAGYVLLTNNTVPAKIEHSDRRYLLLTSNEAWLNDPDYFEPLHAAYADDLVARAFYDFLMARDISKFNPTTDRDLSTAYRELQAVSIPIEARFLHDYIASMEADEKRLTCEQTYEEFKLWCKTNGIESKMNSSMMGACIKQWLAPRSANKIMDWRATVEGKQRRGYTINRHDINAVFKIKNVFQEKLLDITDELSEVERMNLV